MIIIRENEENLARFLSNVLELCDSETMSRILTNSRMTEHDLQILKTEVESDYDNDINYEDVANYIDENKECSIDVLGYLLGSMDETDKKNIIKEHFEDKTDIRMVETIRFEDLNETAQNYAVECYRAELKVYGDKIKTKGMTFDDYKSELEGENFLYDSFGSAVNRE